MMFTQRNANGTTETRRHVEYYLTVTSDLVYAYASKTHRLLGRFVDEQTAHRMMNGMTENVASKNKTTCQICHGNSKFDECSCHYEGLKD